MPITRSRRAANSNFEQNAAAPINRLSPELFAVILQHGLPSPIGHHIRQLPKYSKDRLAYLLAVSAVSSGWRHVALDTAALWSFISFRCYHSQAGSIRRLRMMKTVLGRTKNALLDIFIDLRYSPRSLGTILSNVAATLEPCLVRCRTFSFESNQPEPIRSFFPLPLNMQ